MFLIIIDQGLDAQKILAKLRQSGNKCWPYRASNKYLAGPKGSDNDHYLALSGKLDIYCWPDRASIYYLIALNLLRSFEHPGPV